MGRVASIRMYQGQIATIRTFAEEVVQGKTRRVVGTTVTGVPFRIQDLHPGPARQDKPEGVQVTGTHRGYAPHGTVMPEGTEIEPTAGPYTGRKFMVVRAAPWDSHTQATLQEQRPDQALGAP